MRRLLFLLCVFLLCGPFLLLSCTRRGIEGLKTYAYAGGQQQEGKIAYAETPPVGGAYSPLWQRCGVYTAPLYDEYAVHSLERGAFWITYSPGLPAAEVARLQTLLAQPRARKDGSKAAPPGLLSPREGLRTPVALTVWNAQVQLSGPDDPRLGQMLDEYSLQPTAPEASAGCSSGYSGTQ
jgi:hypothetical protein